MTWPGRPAGEGRRPFRRPGPGAGGGRIPARRGHRPAAALRRATGAGAGGGRPGSPGGDYRVLADGSLRSTQVRRLGRPAPGSSAAAWSWPPARARCSRRGSRWEDFSFELWVYPLLLGDGEVVLDWKGAALRCGRAARRRGCIARTAPVPQGLQAALRDRRLQWVFRNLFAAPEGERVEQVVLPGLTPLVPREWHHHLVRFDAGRACWSTWWTGCRRRWSMSPPPAGPGARSACPRSGRRGPARCTVAESFTGFLDELRLSPPLRGGARAAHLPVPHRLGAQPACSTSATRGRGCSASRRRCTRPATARWASTSAWPTEYHPEWTGSPAGAPSPPPEPEQGWIAFQPGRELPELRGPLPAAARGAVPRRRRGSLPRGGRPHRGVRAGPAPRWPRRACGPRRATAGSP